MNYGHYFKIYIQVMTTNGVRYLTYYPLNEDLGKKGRFLQFGLGKSARSSTWKTFTRDIKADLEKFDKENELIEIKAFFIRGSGLIDDIEVLGEELSDKEIFEKLVTEKATISEKIYPDTFIVSYDNQNTDMISSDKEFFTLSEDKQSLVPFLRIDAETDSIKEVEFRNNNEEMILDYIRLSDLVHVIETYDVSSPLNVRLIETN